MVAIEAIITVILHGEQEKKAKRILVVVAPVVHFVGVMGFSDWRTNVCV